MTTRYKNVNHMIAAYELEPMSSGEGPSLQNNRTPRMYPGHDPSASIEISDAANRPWPASRARASKKLIGMASRPRNNSTKPNIHNVSDSDPIVGTIGRAPILRQSPTSPRTATRDQRSTEWLTNRRHLALLNRMVEQTAERLDDVFHALADRTRREMLRRLSQHDRTITELAQPFDMSLAAASKHVKVLERAGLVERTVQGRTHICRLAPEPLSQAQEWLRFYEKFWNERLDALEAFLQAQNDAASAPEKSPERGESSDQL